MWQRLSGIEHLRRTKAFWDKEVKSESDIAKKRKAYVEALARETIGEIAPFIKPAKLILDVGCGSGRLSIPLAEGGKSVVGLDISRDALLWARRWSRERKTYLHLIQGTAECLPFRCYFDATICFFTVEFASDPFQIAKEFHRILKQGGWLIVSLIPVIDDHVRGSSYRRFMGEKRVLNEILPWEFTSLLKVAGFSILKQAPSEFLVEVPSEVRRWLDHNSRVAMCIALWMVYCKKREMKIRARQCPIAPYAEGP